MWHVAIPRKLARMLLRLPRTDRDRLMKALREMRDDPYGGDLKHLSGHRYRRRVGAYRIIFDIDASRRTVDVTSLGRRSTTTYSLR